MMGDNGPATRMQIVRARDRREDSTMGNAVDDPAGALYEIEQIKQLKARYFRFMDGKRWSDWRTCFSDDLLFYQNEDSEPTCRSGDEMVAYVSGALAGTVTVHQGHMPEIELSGDRTAKGTWSMFDWVEFENDPSRSLQGYGHYIEEYEKGDDGHWRIKTLRLTRIRVDGAPQRKILGNS